MKGSQVSREAWNQVRDVLVTHLPFIGCDHELGLGPGVEDTALSGTRWALIRHTSRKHGGKRVVCQEKGKRSDCGADMPCSGVGKRRWHLG